MTYFLTRSNRVDHTTTDYTEARDIAAALGATVVTRNDLKTLEQAQELAKQADELYARVMAAEIDWTYRPSTLDLIRTAAATPTPEDVPVRYLATDTQGRSPRFDVIEAPQVGDEVSYGFNGDYYPAGRITKISDSYRRIEAQDAQGKTVVFWRRRKSGAWLYGRTWGLVRGRRDERNPSF